MRRPHAAVLATALLLLAAGCRKPADRPAVPATTVETRTPPASPFRFAEVSDRLGPPHVYETGVAAGRNAILESLGGGAAFVDVDRDGRLDVVLPGGGEFDNDRPTGRPTAVRRQRDGGRFDDATGPAGLASPGRYSHGVAVGDYDGDGFPDLLVTGYGGVRLWRNAGDGTFADETVAAGLAGDRAWSTSAAWGDLTGDGVPDLYVARYVNWSPENDPPCNGANGERDVCPPRQFDGLDDSLYVGVGDGTFRDGTAEAGLLPGGKGLGVVLADLDGDRDLDVYVANDTVENFLYVNRGDGRFDERGLASGTAVDEDANANGSMGLAVDDFDGDGRADLWVTNYEEEVFALYRNQGGGGFLHVSGRAGLRNLGTLFVGFGCVAGDFDRDGDDDMAVANGHVVHHPRNAPVLQRPLLLVNGKSRFRDAGPASGPYFAASHAGRGLAAGDFDRDGDLDLLFANSRQPAALLENRTPGGRGLSVRLVGIASARDGVGATVVLTVHGRPRTRFVCGGGSYLSSSPPTVLFGLADGETANGLTVTWPSGRISRVAAEGLAFKPGRTVREILVVEPAE